jgi:rfaE bifunctional protein nucleotidyltransferase chain/domain
MRLAQWRLDPAGAVIVLVTGCFDLLHAGHLDLLTRASRFGHQRALTIAAVAEIPLPRVRLVVGLNSDETVRARKGSDRPLVPFAQRAQLLASLRCVDAVFGFDEPTPEQLIRAVCPDLYVKGGDYRIEELPEAAACREVGATIHIVPRRLPISTSGLVPRLTGVFPMPISLQDSLHGEVVATVLQGNRLSLVYADNRVVELDITSFRVFAGEDDGTD